MPEFPQLPHSLIELIAFLGFLAVQVYNTWQNRQLKVQGDKLAVKQDVTVVKQDAALHNQVELAKQLNGATEIKLVAATEAGIDKGRLEGAATEQAAQAVRVATAADVAQKLSDTKDASAERLEEIRGQKGRPS
jgi:hypothetical protein